MVAPQLRLPGGGGAFPSFAAGGYAGAALPSSRAMFSLIASASSRGKRRTSTTSVGLNAQMKACTLG